MKQGNNECKEDRERRKEEERKEEELEEKISGLRKARNKSKRNTRGHPIRKKFRLDPEVEKSCPEEISNFIPITLGEKHLSEVVRQSEN